MCSLAGQQFFERKEIKDVVAYLRVILNATDEVNLLRIINYPKRGIGDSSIDRLIRYSAEQGLSLWKVLQQAAEVPGTNERTAAAIRSFVNLLTGFSAALPEPAPPGRNPSGAVLRGQIR